MSLVDTIFQIDNVKYKVIKDNPNLVYLPYTGSTIFDYFLNISSDSQSLLVQNISTNEYLLLNIKPNNFLVYLQNVPYNTPNLQTLLGYTIPTSAAPLPYFLNYLLPFDKNNSDFKQVLKDSNTGIETNVYDFTSPIGTNTYNGTFLYKYKDIVIYQMSYSFIIDNPLSLTLEGEGLDTKQYGAHDVVNVDFSNNAYKKYTTARIYSYPRNNNSSYKSIKLPSLIDTIYYYASNSTYPGVNFTNFTLTSDLDTLHIYDSFVGSYCCLTLDVYKIKKTIYATDNVQTNIINNYYFLNDINVAPQTQKENVKIELDISSYTSSYYSPKDSTLIFDFIPSFTNPSQKITDFLLQKPRYYKFTTKDLYLQACKLYPNLYPLFTYQGINSEDVILLPKDTYSYGIYKRNDLGIIYLMDLDPTDIDYHLSISSLDFKNTVSISDIKNKKIDSLIPVNTLKVENSFISITLNLNNKSNFISIDSFLFFKPIANFRITLPKGKNDIYYRHYNWMYKGIVTLLDNDGNDITDTSIELTDSEFQSLDMFGQLSIYKSSRYIEAGIQEYNFNNKAYTPDTCISVKSTYSDYRDYYYYVNKYTIVYKSSIGFYFLIPIAKMDINYKITNDGFFISNKYQLQQSNMFSFFIINNIGYQSIPDSLKLKPNDTVYAYTQSDTIYKYTFTISDKPTTISCTRQLKDDGTTDFIIKTDNVYSTVVFYTYTKDDYSDKIPCSTTYTILSISSIFPDWSNGYADYTKISTEKDHSLGVLSSYTLTLNSSNLNTSIKDTTKLLLETTDINGNPVRTTV